MNLGLEPDSEGIMITLHHTPRPEEMGSSPQNMAERLPMIAGWWDSYLR
jgi:hypothetical protein